MVLTDEQRRQQHKLKRMIAAHPEFDCVDCGCSTLLGDYYMVNAPLWERAGADDAMLCLDCLAKRVGRPLRLSDFTDCPLNLDKAKYLIDRCIAIKKGALPDTFRAIMTLVNQNRRHIS